MKKDGAPPPPPPKKKKNKRKVQDHSHDEHLIREGFKYQVRDVQYPLFFGVSEG